VNVVQIDPQDVMPDALALAVEWLRRGGVVACPTDTLYALAADAESPAAVETIFSLKGRPADAPLPLVAASAEQVWRWCGEPPPLTRRLGERFWPGPLSLLLDAPARAAPAVHAGRGSVAVRVPAHPVPRALAEALGRPITATSANRSGEPAVASVDALAIARDPRLLVIDGGPTRGGAASTIVDARVAPVRLVRDGAIAWNRVLESLQG
jgi:L-threonylcarbamoyladenylate synthase